MHELQLLNTKRIIKKKIYEGNTHIWQGIPLEIFSAA